MGAKYVNHFSLGGGAMRTTVRLESYGVNDSALANANESTGTLLFSFNDLASIADTDIIIITGAGANVSLDSTGGNNTADTPELGIGTQKGAAVQATLGADNAACENLLGPQVMTDCNGTAAFDYDMLTAAPVAGVGTADVYLNVADGWAGVEAISGLEATGDVAIDWFVFSA